MSQCWASLKKHTEIGPGGGVRRPIPPVPGNPLGVTCERIRVAREDRGLYSNTRNPPMFNADGSSDRYALVHAE